MQSVQLAEGGWDNPQTFSKSPTVFFDAHLWDCSFFFLIELNKKVSPLNIVFTAIVLVFIMQILESFKWSCLSIFSLKIANIHVCAPASRCDHLLIPFQVLAS